MKIAPPSPLIARIRAPSAAPMVSPGVPFEELLQAPGGLRQERRERAFGFSELGLLGPPSGSHSVADPLRPPKPPYTEAGATAGPSTAAARSAEAQPLASRIAEPRETTDIAAARAQNRPVKGAVAAVAHAPVNTSAKNESPPAIETEAPESKRAPSRTPSTQSSKPLKLIVFEENGSLQLIAGSAGLSAEERTRLRRAAEAVAAEFGLSLDSFTLDGSEREPPAFTSIGALHGHHRG